MTRVETVRMTAPFGKYKLHSDSTREGLLMANEQNEPCSTGILARPMFMLEFWKWLALPLLQKQKALARGIQLRDGVVSAWGSLTTPG
jgi:hypothetical protein